MDFTELPELADLDEPAGGRVVLGSPATARKLSTEAWLAGVDAGKGGPAVIGAEVSGGDEWFGPDWAGRMMLGTPDRRAS
ncbi:MAG: hypothetical protein ACYCTI_01485 [Acidimicrobiales bacterium]